MSLSKIIDIIKKNDYSNLIPQSIKTDILSDANDLLNGKIRFNNAWDMERCKQEYELVRGKTYYSPNGDPEWVYMYSRLEFLHKLVIAYTLTNEKKYIKKYLNYTNTFYKQNNFKNGALKVYRKDLVSRGLRRVRHVFRSRILQLPERCATYRTLDTAIRSYALTIDGLYLKAIQLNNEETEKIKVRISEDSAFSVAGFTNFDEYSNWGLIKILLYTTCLILQGKKKIDNEERCILQFLNNQIRKDGGHIENSSMYHVQILICLLRLIYWAKHNGIEITPKINEKAKKMTLFAYMICDPLGNQIMYGDSDYTSMNTVLYIASEVLDFDQHLNIGEPDDYILLYEFPTLVDKVKFNAGEKIQNIELDRGIWCFDSDKWCIRAFNESSESGHKHAHNGEVIIYYQNHPIVIDTGRFTYYESNRRMYYRGPFAHNIAIIDNAEEWEPINNWEFKENPSMIQNEIGNLFSGYRMKYVFTSKQYFFERYVMLYNDILVVISLVNSLGGGIHQLKTIWNFMDEVVEKEGSLYTDRLAITYLGNAHIKQGRMSLAYNEEKYIGSHVEISTNFEMIGWQVVCFSPNCIKIEQHNKNFCSINNMKNPKLLIKVENNELKIISEDLTCHS